ALQLSARKQTPKSSTATDFHASDGPQFMVKSFPLKVAHSDNRDHFFRWIATTCSESIRDQYGAMTGIAGCARAESGHAAALPTSVMNPRRFIRSPRRRGRLASAEFPGRVSSPS